MAMTDFTIITRSLTTRLFSTLTTVATVAVAVALLLVLLTMRDAGRRAFERGSGTMHLLVSRDASPLVSVLNGVFYAGAPRNPIGFDEYERLAKSAPFEWAIPLQLGDSYQARHPVVATTKEFFTKFEPAEATQWTLADGRYFEREFEVVVGAAAARAARLAVGHTISLTHGAAGGDAAAAHQHADFPYTVVGVLNPTGTPHDRALFTNLDSTWIIHRHDRLEREAHSEHHEGEEGHEHEGDAAHAHDDHDHAHDEHGDHAATITPADLEPIDRKITTVYLRVATRPGSDVSSSLAPIFDRLRRDPSITVASPTQEIGKLFAIVGSIDVLFLAIAVAVMVSSGIAIMLALYNSMEQRRRQVAVLRVLGASRARVFGLVVTESALIGVLGAALGVLVAVGGAFLAADALKDRVGLVIDPALPPRAVFAVVLATVALAALAGIVPALVAYRTSVANNLRPLG